MKTWVDGFLALQLHSFLVTLFWTGFYLALHFGKGIMVKYIPVIDSVDSDALPQVIKGTFLKGMQLSKQ